MEIPEDEEPADGEVEAISAADLAGLEEEMLSAGMRAEETPSSGSSEGSAEVSTPSVTGSLDGLAESNETPADSDVGSEA